MGKRTVTVTVEGHGVVTVKQPKTNDHEQFADAVADAVVQTMQLMDPSTIPHRFHPALGYKDN